MLPYLQGYTQSLHVDEGPAIKFWESVTNAALGSQAQRSIGPYLQEYTKAALNDGKQSSRGSELGVRFEFEEQGGLEAPHRAWPCYQ